MATNKRRFGSAIPRLQQDYMNLQKDPVPYIRAEPSPADMLEWHYCIRGPENTPFFGGYYHGTLVFTQQYPFKPPAIYMATPNGRFDINRRLCLSISDYHPDEWNPAWCVSSILTGLLSFMLENSSSALGTVVTNTHKKIELAQKSLEYNLKNTDFVALFPDVCEEINEKLTAIRTEAIKNGEAVSVPATPAAAPQNVQSSDSIASNFIFIICVAILGLVAFHFYGNFLD